MVISNGGNKIKKVICLVMFVFLSLLFVPNVVYAQDKDVFPYNPQQVLEFPLAPRMLEFYDYVFVQENENTFEYIIIYYLPYRVNMTFDDNDYFFVYNYPYGFYRGVINRTTNSYKLENQFIESDRTELHFRMTIQKTRLPDEDPYNIPVILTELSRMYLGIDEQDAYQRGFTDGVKSITNKYMSYVFKWTLPFVSLVIISAIYVGYKKEWFHND